MKRKLKGEKMSGVNFTKDQYEKYYQQEYGNYNSTVTDPIKKEEVQKQQTAENLQNALKGEAKQSDVIPGLGVEKQADARQLSTKAERKQAKEEVKQEFLQYGKADGTKVSEKEAKKLAKNYVENEYNKEQSEFTEVFMDKDKYKAAEKARKEKRSELIEQYKKDGLSKKEAKRKADAQLTENTYLRKGLFGQRKTREYVEEHKADFYDKDGNFSSDKFKAKAVEFANTHTLEDETTNYHLSLKERRAVAQQEGTNASIIKNIAKKSNIGYERDNTNLYRGIVIGAAVGAGIAAGPLFGSSSAAAAAASSSSAATGGSAAAAASSAAASAAAAASVNGTLIGAAAGTAAGTGLASLFKDRGNKEARVYAPGQPQPKPQPPKPDPMPQESKPETPVVQPNPLPEEKPCPIEAWQEDYCDYKPKKGEYWSVIVAGKYTHEDGSKLTQAEQKAVVHALKLKHGINNFALNTQPPTMRLHSDFSEYTTDEYIKKHPEFSSLVGKDFCVNCDGKVVTSSKKTKVTTPYTRYNGQNSDPAAYKQDCHDNNPVRISHQQYLDIINGQK